MGGFSETFPRFKKNQHGFFVRFVQKKNLFVYQKLLKYIYLRMKNNRIGICCLKSKKKYFTLHLIALVEFNSKYFFVFNLCNLEQTSRTVKRVEIIRQKAIV